MRSEATKRMYLIVVLAFLISTGSNVNADFTFGEPENLGPTVNSSSYDNDTSISADGLELYFSSNRPGGLGADTWVTTRETVQDPWGEPVNLGPEINSSADDGYPSI